MVWCVGSTPTTTTQLVNSAGKCAGVYFSSTVRMKLHMGDAEGGAGDSRSRRRFWTRKATSCHARQTRLHQTSGYSNTFECTETCQAYRSPANTSMCDAVGLCSYNRRVRRTPLECSTHVGRQQGVAGQVVPRKPDVQLRPHMDAILVELVIRLVIAPVSKC